MLINMSFNSKIDDSLINGIAKKDEKAFEEFYTKTKKMIFCISFSITKSVADSEDITQETYLKIIKNAQFYESNQRALAWVYKIARNTSISYVRNKKTVTNLDNYTDDIRLSTINNEDIIVLKSALNILSEEELNIVLLHSAGIKNREMAKLLNIPLSTVISKYNRSLLKMRKDINGGMPI